MRESEIERYFNKCAKKCGALSYKWTSPGHRAVPDRILIRRDRPIFFIELKQEGKEPTQSQWREISRLRLEGCHATYLAGAQEVRAFFRHYASDTYLSLTWLYSK